jgi:hypothetical protein
LISDTSQFEKELKAEVTSIALGKALSTDVIIDNDKLLHCVFCPECNPTP